LNIDPLCQKSLINGEVVVEYLRRPVLRHMVDLRQFYLSTTNSDVRSVCGS